MRKLRRGFRKVAGGFKRTRTAVIRLPDRLQPVSIREAPLSHQLAAKVTSLKRKKARHQPETRLGVDRKAKEQGGKVSAPTPAPEAATPAQRQMRKAWSGKYADLTQPTPDPP
jgi:hypothetical protein